MARSSCEEEALISSGYETEDEGFLSYIMGNTGTYLR